MGAQQRARSNAGTDRLFDQLCLRPAHRRLRASAYLVDLAQSALLFRADRRVWFQQGNRLLRVVVQRSCRGGETLAQVGCAPAISRSFHYSPWRSAQFAGGEQNSSSYLQRGLEGQLGFCSFYRRGVCPSNRGNEAATAG